MIEIEGLALTGLAPPPGRASPLKQSEAQGAAGEGAFAAILSAAGLQVPSTPEAEQSLSGELAIAFKRPDRNAEAGIANPEATESTFEVLQGVAALQSTLLSDWSASAPASEGAPARSAALTAPLAPVLRTAAGRAPLGVGPAVASQAVAAPEVVAPAISPAATDGVTQVGPDGLPEAASQIAIEAAESGLFTLRSTASPRAASAPVATVATVRAASDVVSTDAVTFADGESLPQVEALASSAAGGSAGSSADAGVGPRAQAGEFDLGPASVDPDRSGVAIELAARPDQASAAPAAPDGVAVAGVTTAQPVQTAQPAASDEVSIVETATSPERVASQMADTVQRAVRVDGRELRLQLSPPELGQLEVRVVESSDGVRVSLTASTREAGELIQQHLPFLRASLEARDLQVDRLDVLSPELTDDGSDGAPRDRTAAGGQGEDGPVWSPLAGQSSQQEGSGDGGTTVDRGQSRLDAGTLDVLA